MKSRILAYIKQHNMIKPGDVVCVGCSGGADSVCLLVVLDELRKEGVLEMELCACHLNHQLRGAESDADQAYVEELCREYGIPLFCRSEDVAARAQKHKASSEKNEGSQASSGENESSRAVSGENKGPRHAPEDAGREVRRDFYRTCMEQYGVTKIALAHHADDQAETVLLHMARGAGLGGMTGIWPVRGPYIRPLLFLRRTEIEAWLTEQGISWRTDVTNAGEEYARNRLRHRIIPELESAIHGNAAVHIGEAAEILRLADEWIRQEAADRAGALLVWKPESSHCSYKDGVLQSEQDKQKDAVLQSEQEEEKGAIEIKVAAVQEPELLQRYLIMQALEELVGDRQGFGGTHIRMVQDLLHGRVSRRADLPRGVTAVRTYEGVRLFIREGERQGRRPRQLAEGQAAPPKPAADGILPAPKPASDGILPAPKPASDGILPAPKPAADGIRLVPAPADASAPDNNVLHKMIPLHLQKPGETQTAVLGSSRFTCQIVTEWTEPIPEKTYTKWLNCDMIHDNLVFRTRRPGDFLILNAKGDRQSLKAWMINRKIPADMRDRMPVLASDSRILWVPGGRIGWDVRVTKETKQVLKIIWDTKGDGQQ